MTKNVTKLSSLPWLLVALLGPACGPGNIGSGEVVSSGAVDFGGDPPNRQDAFPPQAPPAAGSDAPSLEPNDPMDPPEDAVAPPQDPVAPVEDPVPPPADPMPPEGPPMDPVLPPPSVLGSLGQSGLFEPACCDGQGYLPPGALLYPEAPLTRPATGQTVRDQRFRVSLTGLPLGVRHQYSQLQAFSHDETLFLSVNDQVLDLPSFRERMVIDESSPRWIPGTRKIVAVGSDPVRVFEFDVDAGSKQVVLNLAPYVGRGASVAWEELDRAGRWLPVFITNDGQGRQRILSVNLQERRIGMDRSLQDLGCTYDPDWVGVSPLGNYVVVQWKTDGFGLCSGLQLYDIETGTFVRQVHGHHNHSDLGLTSDGREFMMSVEFQHPDNANYPAAVAYWLDGSPKRVLRMLPWGRFDHVSCQGPASVNACVVTTSDDFEDNAFKAEIMILTLEGDVYRLGHHRSNDCNDYYAQPHASWSPSGAKIVFATTWGGGCAALGGAMFELPELQR
jgi:hypothetical protein